MFTNRSEAGINLSIELSYLKKDFTNTVVVAIPRGGIPVAYEIAKKFKRPLDIMGVKKIKCPSHMELALGAITEDNHVVYNPNIIQTLNVSKEELSEYVSEYREQAIAQAKELRSGRLPIKLKNKDIILVDDGIATGATIKASVESLREKKVETIILAIPVASPHSLAELKDDVDIIVTLLRPEVFFSVGQYYRDFKQVNDYEVSELLNRFRE